MSVFHFLGLHKMGLLYGIAASGHDVLSTITNHVLSAAVHKYKNLLAAVTQNHHDNWIRMSSTLAFRLTDMLLFCGWGSFISNGVKILIFFCLSSPFCLTSFVHGPSSVVDSFYRLLVDPFHNGHYAQDLLV